MRYLRETLTNVWDQLNPSEPDARFLAIFFASAMALFAIAFLIGHL
jgi:hypothetical protein